METLVINNFSGVLTRNNLGDLNSGLAKFDTSFGYNPFFKPGQLTWFRSPINISSIITNGLVVASCSRIESGTIVTYAITNTVHLFKLLGEGSSASDIATLTSGSPTFTYGASMEFYGAADTIYIAHDKGVTSITTAGASETQIGTWGAAGFTAITTKRALCEFIGRLFVINSDPSVTYANNIAEIDSTGTVVSYAVLSPSLPAGTYIRDLDVNPNLTYLLISASLIPSELILPVNDGGNTGSSVSTLYQWNGTDAGVTTGIALPNFGTTSLQSFGNAQMMFMYDTFGAALYDGNRKRVTMRNGKSPMPNATASAGNFVSWVAPEMYWNLDTEAGAMVAGLFYYGQLDENSPQGLYRMFRQTSTIGGAVYQMPWNQYTTNRYISVNTSATTQVDSNGTHIYSFIDYTGSGGQTAYKHYIFYVSPPDNSPGGWTGAIGGVYETQTQQFSKRISVEQIRVYTEPTVANNAFTLQLIGSNGKVIPNSAFTYAYGDALDPATDSASLERINYNPNIAPTYALGLRITNTGSANMAINKIEIDWSPSGK